MNTNSNPSSDQIIVGPHNWQSWLVLRHFLPARLQREVVRIAISVTSNNTVSFDDLFEEVHVDTPIWNERWIVRPRSHPNWRLIEWTRAILWQNDLGIISSTKEDEAYSNIVLLNALTRLSHADLQNIEAVSEGIRTQETITTVTVESNIFVLLEILEVARHTEKNIKLYRETVLPLVNRINLPLRAIVLKHLGDLYADNDQWRHAKLAYEEAQGLVRDWDAPSTISDLKSSWDSIISHSIVTAISITESPESAIQRIDETIDSTDFQHNPLLVTNVSLDSLILKNLASPHPYQQPDNRPSSICSPLLLTHHHTEHAITKWLRGDYDDASRSFWALLRRQIALGSAAESRETKAWYAQNILEHLAKRTNTTLAPDKFSMAVRLLIASEHTSAIARIDWTPSLINDYITDIESLRVYDSQATVFDGVKIARTKVIVQLYRTWIRHLQTERAEIAQWMWIRISEIALQFPATFDETDDIGRPALEALRELAQHRPEWARNVAATVTKALSYHIRSTFRWGQTEAISAARQYVDVSSFSDLQELSEAILEALESEDPQHDFWPLIRPAFNFLVHPTVRRHLRKNPELDQRCLDQILRFGLEAEGEKTSLLFWLANFDDAILEQEDIKIRLKEPIDHIRKKAQRINSSNVTDHILALLVAPSVSGPDGVRDALLALLAIFKSANTDRRSLGLPLFDGPLLSIAEQIDTLRKMPNAEQELDPLLKTLVDQLEAVWILASSDPLVFAPFAIPQPNRPNKVLVHNCAFASLRFAQRLGESERIRNALSRASENQQELAGSISMAKATHATGAEYAGEYLDEDEPLGQDSGSFYGSLGRRLVQLQHLPKDKERHRCKQLLEHCFRFGPKSEDAAVLIYALQLNVLTSESLTESDIKAYEQRVQQNAEIRLLLSPLIGLLRTKTMDQS